MSTPEQTLFRKYDKDSSYVLYRADQNTNTIT
jgi:uncharacterized protein YktA (UPF0223 family)